MRKSMTISEMRAAWHGLKQHVKEELNGDGEEAVLVSNFFAEVFDDASLVDYETAEASEECVQLIVAAPDPKRISDAMAAFSRIFNAALLKFFGTGTQIRIISEEAYAA